MRSYILLVLAVLACAFVLPAVRGFTRSKVLTRSSRNVSPRRNSPAFVQLQQDTVLAASRSRNSDSSNFLLEEFSIYNGEVLDPYKVLKVHRSAERQEIRQKYINLSRRYHPDVVMHKDILPGSCNNLEEVRDQWERIKLAYEILSDKRMRKRYDRHETISDPKAALKRAASDAAGNAAKEVGKGIFNAGKGLFNMGAKAVSESMQKGKEEKP